MEHDKQRISVGYTTQSVVRRRADAEVIATGSGDVLVRNSQGATVLRHLAVEDLRAILAVIDGKKTLDAVVKELSEAYEADDLFQVLGQLAGTVIEFDDANSSAAPTNDRFNDAAVGIVGTGRIAKALLAAFGVAGVRAVAVPIYEFASLNSERFKSRHEAEVIDGPRLANSRETPRTTDEIAAMLDGFSLVVCALEDVPYRAVLDLNEAAQLRQTPILFVSVDSQGVVLGPSFVPGRTACFACAQLRLVVGDAVVKGAADAMELFHALSLEKDRSFQTDAIACEVLAEARELLAPAGAPQFLTQLKRIRSNGSPDMISPVVPLTGCRYCGIAQPSCDTNPHELAASVAVAKIWLLDREECADPIRTVGIIGGGTAGYLTALALRGEFPHLEVTLIESSEIPIIGVGEATTPALVQFLHEKLEIDRADFYRRVKPTWKLGIKFFWGPPGDSYFNYPFGVPHLLEALLYGGDTNRSSFESRLMSTEKSPILHDGSGGFISLLDQFVHAYHLDNKRFVGFLQAEAASRGVTHLDAKIVDAKTTDGCPDQIDYVCTADGRRLAFDLFVDCTGFSSRLMGGTLGSKFLPYNSTLFTDTAVVADVPHNGALKPYTLAESMSHGWCWNIPQVDCDHRGYVFSSAFASVEEAASEMRAKNPGMRDSWTVKFRSGRHEHFWKGNVVAIGNAYGFVEPLESTALHMVVVELRALLSNFPVSKSHESFKQVLNRRIGNHWDYLRWFLGLHYKFNRKYSTPFWEACRAKVDISGMEEMVAIFRDAGPLSYRVDRDLLKSAMTEDLLFDVSGIDVLLMGQGLPTRLVRSPVTRELWERCDLAIEDLVRRALPQQEALEVLSRNPHMLSHDSFPRRVAAR